MAEQQWGDGRVGGQCSTTLALLSQPSPTVLLNGHNAYAHELWGPKFGFSVIVSGAGRKGQASCPTTSAPFAIGTYFSASVSVLHCGSTLPKAVPCFQVESTRCDSATARPVHGSLFSATHTGTSTTHQSPPCCPSRCAQVLPGAPSPPLAAGQRPPSQPLPMLPIPLPSILEYSKAGYNTAGCAGMPNPNLNSTPIASAAATLPSLSAAAGYCAGVSSAAPPPVRPAVVARRSGSDTLLRSLGLAVPAGATGVGSGGMQGGSGGLQGVPNRPNGPNGRSGASPRYPLPLPQVSFCIFVSHPIIVHVK